MTTTETATSAQHVPLPRQAPHTAVGEPVPFAWREGTLTRAKELETLAHWYGECTDSPEYAAELLVAIDQHLTAARQAARPTKRRFLGRMDGALLERAISNLDAAQADLLQVVPATYLLGQMPSLLNEVQRHLTQTDARRQEFEWLAMQLGVHAAARAAAQGLGPLPTEDKTRLVEAERNMIVSIVRGAGSAALREQLRVRSFRNVLVITAGMMMLLAITLGLVGWFSPSSVPLCFQPEQGGQVVVICPTGQSAAVTVAAGEGPTQPKIDALVNRTVRPGRYRHDRGDRPDRRLDRVGGGAAADPRLVRTARPAGGPGAAEIADRCGHGRAGSAADARRIPARPERPGHLGADSGLGDRLRLRPAIVHPVRRPAGRHRAQ